ncbi:MAG: succinate dehydrogenase iron-sulfur subunit, partial [Kineosporiaceae bacterium]
MSSSTNAAPPSPGSRSAGGGRVGEVPSFDVTLRILRYNPEVDEAAHWEDYKVTVHGTDRLLEALHKIKW